MMIAIFVLNSVLLGAGLAMDAVSVSVANGLAEPDMTRRRAYTIAGTFAFFQFLMPMLGWVCVHTLVERFREAERFVPWVALLLLLYIGGSMLYGALRGGEGEVETGAGKLLLQGVATSIDALSVGFTIATYAWGAALACSLLIALVTFALCLLALRAGRAAGKRLSQYAPAIGGVILIAIGIEIFLRS